VSDKPPRGAIVRLPGEAESLRMSGFDILVHASAADTGGAFVLLETREQTAGGGPPLHIHHDAAESFLVLAGEYSMHIDGHDYRCPSGSFIYIPQGMPHRFVVATDGSRKLNLFAPAAMEGYFRELAAALVEGVDDSRLAEIADRYSMEVLEDASEAYLDADR
jgi:mannose-6-phosphate isomerase-like protein (cupin superfamily)